MGKDFERANFAGGRENGSKNGSEKRSKTVLFGVKSGAQNDAKNTPNSASQNVPKGGRKPRISEHRNGAEIDADSRAESRAETRAKTRAISIQKIAARDAENMPPNTKQAVIRRLDRRIHGTLRVNCPAPPSDASTPCRGQPGQAGL